MRPSDLRPPLLLELDLTEVPVDPDGDDPLARLRQRGRRQLRPTLRALAEAAGHRRVRGLVAKVGGPLPWTVMQELRLGVTAFAASGKPTVAWAESFSETGDLTAYVLASAFDRIWLQPGGGLGMLGVGVEPTFLRGVLDRLGVTAELEQRHEYKNAVNTLTETGLTPAHREALEQLTRSLQDEAVERIAEGRGLTVDRVRGLVDTGPRTAPEAQAAGLVDALGFRDQVLASVREQVGTQAELLFADRWSPRPRVHRPWPRPGRVALVEARGTIVSGRTRRGASGRQLGSDSVAAELRAVLADDHIRAVVLHVDSPGGSAVASETIWREVVRVRESGRPVVVSMASLAASGGYYIACAADVILALPATLTGSIGVFGGKLVVEELLARAGVGTDRIDQGERSSMFSPRRRFTAAERDRFAATVDAIYDDFTAKVAQGRGLSRDQVEAVARGRVWTGRDALERGLVDRLGGLREAVAIARDRAGLPTHAPVGPAARVAPLARLGRPRSSDDPRARAGLGWPGLAELTTALGLPAAAELRMPALRLR
ncbi:MAG: signal peptide peptidase SppA, type [Friedmanniella sp.]|nr:signal peptide peptidase SppA, type [Friedmanniella sp.]